MANSQLKTEELGRIYNSLDVAGTHNLAFPATGELLVPTSTTVGKHVFFLSVVKAQSIRYGREFSLVEGSKSFLGHGNKW